MTHNKWLGTVFILLFSIFMISSPAQAVEKGEIYFKGTGTWGWSGQDIPVSAGGSSIDLKTEDSYGYGFFLGKQGVISALEAGITVESIDLSIPGFSGGEVSAEVYGLMFGGCLTPRFGEIGLRGCGHVGVNYFDIKAALQTGGGLVSVGVQDSTVPAYDLGAEITYPITSEVDAGVGVSYRGTMSEVDLIPEGGFAGAMFDPDRLMMTVSLYY